MEKPTQTTTDGSSDIAQPARKKPVLLVILGGLILLLVTHFYFNSKKTTSKSEFQVEESYTTLTSAPEKSIAVPVKEKSEEEEKSLSEQQLALLEEKQKELEKRLAAPMLILNQESKDHTHHDKANKTLSADANSQFLQQVSATSHQSVQATKIESLNRLIGEGQIIHAILETAINSDLPGSLRATIDQPVYAEDGSQVLIPPGSRLIGQYKSGMLQGQSRVFVVWTRLMTPEGISLNLASPGVDTLGMAGMAADTIDHHFWRQFGSAILLSVLGVGTSNVGVAENTSYNATQAYRIAVANSLNQTAQQALQQQGMIPPTLWINQGSPIQVFVAHDLDFKAVNQTADSKINIF